MTLIFKKYRYLWLIAIATLALFIGYKVIAQSTPATPLDFDNGPLVAKNQPANVVLALSVEFPTSGGAYKDGTYVDGKEYLGYFNSNRCYSYPGYGNIPRTAQFDANTDYFSPTGATNSSYYCNVAGAATGFSGNYLNYATMSAPDILRLALTGGDRGIDEASRTVLDRGTTAAPYGRTVAAALVAQVSPFNNGVTLYAYNCSDRVIFTTNTGRNNCNLPTTGDTSDLSPIVASSVAASGTTTVTPTIPPIQWVGTTWSDTGSLTTTIPTIGPTVPVTLYTTSRVLTTNAFNCPASPCVTESGAAIDTSIKATSYTVQGTSTTPAPAAWPMSGTLPDRTIKGYYWTGASSATVPVAAAENPPVPVSYIRDGTTSTVAPVAGPADIYGYERDGTTSTVAPFPAQTGQLYGYTWIDAGYDVFSYQGGGAPNSSIVANRQTYVCYDTAAPFRIRLGPQTANPTCAAGQTEFRYNNLTSTTNRLYYNYYTQGVPIYYDYRPVYFDVVPFYKVYAPYYASYNRIDSYWEYTSYTKYRVLFEQAVWNSYNVIAKAIVKPRPLVCDSVEGPTRTVVFGTGTSDFYNYCTKYEFAGVSGYKPEGQIQQKSENLRVSVFSYLMDNSAARYGGVMRAPMKYVGPNKYDELGNLLVNPQREWKVTTGQFEDKPINDTESTGFANSGVINYLNKFGKTGNYKTFDVTGELWYEALRYLQGLAPTPEASTGMTTAMKDGYPVYETWTDPLTSACQRNNYILGIGDTNTHWDRTMPGITKAEQIAGSADSAINDFQYYATPTIKGSGTALDAHTWTRIMDGFERSGAAARTYTDSKARAQTTAGKNTSPTTGISDLDTRGTGSGSRSSYHWAGLSYWANTQPIRTDIKGGSSMDKVRVKTFMIDVDENNRGSVGASIRQTSYYLAGKYGYFDDSEQTGNPFVNGDTGWAGADGNAKGYVLASQPQRLVAGIKKFFDESTGGGNSFATVAVSSNSLSATAPNGQTFEPSFIPGQWGGTIKSVQLGLNTVTNTLERGSVTWDAGEILTSASREVGAVALPKVRPDQRNIITYIAAGTPRGVTFTYAATSNGADLPTTFNQVPYTTSVDNQAEARINYLRGDRTKELDETYRPRQTILGDIINSGPFYKGSANPNINGADYPAFTAAKASRTPVIYSGANDGMMHAFKADTGQELFAYIPSGVLAKMPNLTSKSYIHELFVDAVPAVDEVRASSGWKTVLASGMGGGAQGIFALDVTDPTNFNTSKVMFEFTDLDDPAMGNVTSQPQFVKMLTAGSIPASYKYYIVVSSGYNNYKNDGSGRYTTLPDQALFFLDVNKAIGTPWAEGTNYFKVVLPAAQPTKANGLAQPGIRLGSAGEGIEFFVGDMQGNMWKAAFSGGISSAKAASAVRKNGSSIKTPLFIAKDTATNIQPITSAPVIYPYVNGGNMIIFGTGRLLESVDRSTTSTQAIYGIWDSGQSGAADYSLDRTKLTELTLNATTLALSGSTATFSSSSGSKRGWFFNLTRDKERIVIDPVATTGVVQFSSTIPPSSECTDNGNSLVYFLNPGNGMLVSDVAGDSGYFGKGNIIIIDTSSSTTSSYSARTVSGARTATFKTGVRVPGPGGQQITRYFDSTYLRTGRVYWREVRDFNLVTQ